MALLRTRRHRLAGLLALAALALAAAGASAAGPAAPPPVVARDGVPVTVANRQIIILRGPIAGYSASERATAAMERINRALDALPDAIVTVEPAEDGSTRVRVGGEHAFLVTPIDVDAQAGETTRLVAQAASQRLDQAILERHEQQTPRYLTEALGFASAATLLYGTLLWLIFRSLRWARERLAQLESDLPRKELIGTHMIDTGQALLACRRALGLIAWAIAIVLASPWLSFVLERFPYTRPWGEQLQGGLLGIVKDAALGTVAALPGLLIAIVIFLIARAVIRILAAVFDRVERGERQVGWVDSDTARPTRRIFSLVVWAFALSLAFPHLPGAQTDAFKGVSVLLGLMVSLGAASVVGQAFSGFILMYGRAFRRGDYVRIGEHEGTVEMLGTFTTRLRTGLGDELILPNSVVMAGSIRNYSRVAGSGAGCVLDAAVTIGYSAPWRQVHAMLENAARRTEGLAADPAPYVRQTALSDFYVEYRLVAYTPVEDPGVRTEVLSRLYASIQDVFNEHGVQIMSPHYLGDPAEAQVVPKERWYAPPAKPPGKEG